MLVWRILALCAIGICAAPLASSDDLPTSIDTLKTGDLSASEDLIALASDYIPFSEGRQQVFASTADLIKSFLGEAPKAPELPAVIPAGSKLPARIPSIHVEVPDAPTIYQAPVTTPPVTTTPRPVTTTPRPVTTTPRPVTTTARPVTIAPGPVPITASHVPPKPYFNRTMHLRVDLTVPASDYTEAYDVEYHAESNTARTTVEDSYTIYRGPTSDGKVQYFKIQLTSKFDSPERHCTESPALPASPADSIFPGLPDLKPFNFVGYKTEEGKKLEHWMHAVVGRPGEIGAASGESLNYTHGFFVYRDGEDAVPFKYTVTTDSSVLGPASDSYTHRYVLLAPPTSPLIPDRDKLCDVVMEYTSGKPRSRRAVKKP